MSSIWVESYQRDLAWSKSLEFLFGHLGAFVVCSFATLVSRNPGFEGAHLDPIIAGHVQYPSTTQKVSLLITDVAHSHDHWNYSLEYCQ